MIITKQINNNQTLKKMKLILLTLSLCFVFSFSFGQTEVIIKGVILAVEDDKVYLDLNESNITIGDRLQVIEDRGFFTHPVTGEQIAREPEIVAYIQITDVMSNYSIGTISPRGAISKLADGMEAFLLEGEARDSREFRKSIAVQPLNVSSARGGYLGFYIADLLTEELFNIDKFRVIDRQTLGLQMDEIALTTQGVIDEREAIQLGRTRGVNYFITGTVYEPDVVETGTGVPVKGIMQAAEAISGQRLGSELVSDVRVSQLRAIVNITLRVVDVETGEIIFIASEMQQAQGRSQINLEQGALGGLQLQGGATSFLNTITGQATKAALVNLAGYINDYFEGKIDVRNFRGNIIEIGKVGTRSERREERNASITHAEILKLSGPFDRGEYKVRIDKGKETNYRKNFPYNVYEPVYEESKITGETIITGRRKIGSLRIEHIEDNLSQGNLKLVEGVRKTENYQFQEAEVEFYRLRPLSVTPIFFSKKVQGWGPISYRFNSIFAIGTRYKFVYFQGGWAELLDVYGSIHYRLSKNFESFANIGFSVGAYTTAESANYAPIIFDLGARFYLTNWMAIDLLVPAYPVFSIGGGLSFHMF